jgi:mannose-6-phosphate isomerase-like protein (cupin superfamily)
MQPDQARRQEERVESPEAVVLSPGDGRHFTVGADRVIVKAESVSTEGQFSIIEYAMPPGVPGPPPHVHRKTREIWYVLAGDLVFLAGADSVPASTGAFVHIPPGVVHTFSNVGTTVAKWIGIFSPGDGVKLVEAIGEALPVGGGPPDEKRLAEAFSLHDMEVVTE